MLGMSSSWVLNAEQRKELEELFEAELKLRPKNIKNIEDLKTTPYPTSVNQPDPEFNFLVGPGRFRYHRSFLLQFVNVCTEKPVSLVSLDVLGLDPREASTGYSVGTRGRGRRFNTVGRGGEPSSERQTSIGLGLGPGLANRRGFATGRFQPSPTSQSQFEASNAARARGTPFARGRYFARGGFQRDDYGRNNVSDSDGWNVAGEAGATRSSARAGDLSQFGKITKPTGIQFGPSSVFGKKNSNQRDNFGRPRGVDMFSALSTGTADGPLPPADRMASGRKPSFGLATLLDQLEAGDFDTASDHIVEWANKSEREEDGRTLKEVTELIYKRVVDKPAVSGMYARLCRKVMERVSPNVQDKTIRNSEGQPISGGMLFRKYLLNRCQEDFERGWSTTESEVTPEAYRDAERSSRCPVEFIGELFKSQMLTERIMHECIKKLISNVVNPEEEEIESLCELLTNVGQSLDNPKARNHMDIYFERMQEMAKGGNISNQMQLKLLNVIELRARRWQAHSAVPGRHNVTRGGSRRGEHRGANATEPDGWNVAGGGAARPSARAGDLSQFGKIQKPTGIQFGPSSVFSKGANKRDSSIGRAGGANMFFALSTGAADGPPPPVERTTSSRKPSVDLGPGGSPATASGERRKLNLLPRTKPAKAEADKAGDKEEDKEALSAAMTEEEAQTKVKEDVKEYLGVENIDEAIMALEALPSEHRHLFVDKLINASMDGGNKVVVLAEKLFSAARSRSVISPEGFERGMLPTIEMADDLSIDVPKTYEWLARMMHAAGLDKTKAEEMASKISVYGEPRVPPKELLVKEYEKASSA